MTIRVCDDGRGIPADRLETIFDRFEQVDSSDMRQQGGSGLGLAICRGIVERHGGRVWLDSELGRGTTAHLVLPAGGPPPSRRPAAPALPRTPWSAPGGNGRVGEPGPDPTPYRPGVPAPLPPPSGAIR